MTTYYVDGQSGNDSSGTGAGASPWRTLAKGYAALNNGDTLRVRTATYYEVLNNKKNGVTIEADTGHTPTIDGRYSAALFGAAGYTNANGTQIGSNQLPSLTTANKNRGNWVIANNNAFLVSNGGVGSTIRGFVIRNAAGRLFGMGGENNRAENLTMDFAYGGACMIPGDHNVMTNCIVTRGSMKYFDPTRPGSGGEKVQSNLIVKGTGNVVEYSTIAYNYAEGLALDQTARNIEIRYNTLHTNYHWSLGINESHGHRIYGNVLYWCLNLLEMMGGGDAGQLFTISAEQDVAPFDVNDNFVWNNLFVGGDRGLLIAGGTSGRRCRLVNTYFGYNTFVGRPETSAPVYFGVIGSNPHRNLLFENNVIWKHAGGANIATLQNGLSTATATFRNNVSNAVLPGLMSGVDSVVVAQNAPVMVNPAANFVGTFDVHDTSLPTVTTTFSAANYDLSSDSAAIGRASNRSASAGVTPPTVNIDRRRATRTDLNPSAGRYYDAGSVEFGGTVTDSVTAAFSRNPTATTLVQGASVTFTNSSLVTGAATITGQTWTVRKSGTVVTTATTTNYNYTFATTGSYTVELAVTASGGLSDSETLAYTITEGGGGVVVTAAFSAAPSQTTIPQGYTIAFTDQTTVQNGTQSGRTWQVLTVPGLSVVHTATTATLFYQFNTAGAFRVKLTATATTGESDTETLDYTVTSVATPTVSASFTMSDGDGVVPVGTAVTFTDTSTASNTTITGRAWSVQRVGSGQGAHTYATTNITHTFTQAGMYTVTLVTTTAAGISDTETATVTVQAGATTGMDFMVVPVSFAVNTSAGTQTVTAAALGSKIPKGVHIRLVGAAAVGTAAAGAIYSDGAGSDTAQWVHTRVSADSAGTTAARRRWSSGAIIMTLDSTGAVTGQASLIRFVAGGMELNISDGFPSGYRAEALFYAGDVCDFWAGSVGVGAANANTPVVTGIDQDAVYLMSTWAASENTTDTDAEMSRGWAIAPDPESESEGAQFHFRNEDQHGKDTSAVFGRWQPRIASANEQPDGYSTIEIADFHVGGFNLRPASAGMGGRVASMYAFAAGGYRVSLHAVQMDTGATWAHGLDFEAQTVTGLVGSFTGDANTQLGGTQPETSGWLTVSTHGPTTISGNIAAANGAATSSTRSYLATAARAVGPSSTDLWNGAAALDATGLTVTWTAAPASAYRAVLLGIEVGQVQGATDDPVADFSADVDANERTGRASVWFSSAQSSGNGQTITAWLWDFGDGTTSTEANPMHIYEQPGAYTVSLTVTTSAGSGTKTVEALVLVQMVEATADIVGPSNPKTSGGATGNEIDENGDHTHAVRFDWAHFRALDASAVATFVEMQPDAEYALWVWDDAEARVLIKRPDGTHRAIATTAVS